MGVNRQKKHLVVLTEDSPYRSIMNGVKISLNTNDIYIDVKDPCGGWSKVFEALESNLILLNRYPKCHILLLIDFDDKNEGAETNFKKRIAKFNKVVSQTYKNRVFILGTNYKESEALKKEFATPNFENIGEKLVNGCPNGDLKYWQNIHLECNLPEIKRMRINGIFEWLFT
jgi:hypothetical protein